MFKLDNNEDDNLFEVVKIFELSYTENNNLIVKKFSRSEIITYTWGISNQCTKNKVHFFIIGAQAGESISFKFHGLLNELKRIN